MVFFPVSGKRKSLLSIVCKGAKFFETTKTSLEEFDFAQRNHVKFLVKQCAVVKAQVLMGTIGLYPFPNPNFTIAEANN